MKLKTLSFIALVSLSVPVFAGGFEHYDKNADGMISADELGEKKAHKIEKIDTDGDQLISKEEFKAYKEKKRRSKTY